MPSHVFTIDCHSVSLTPRLCRLCKPGSRTWQKRKPNWATRTGGDASRIAMKSVVCSHLPEDMQIVIEFCLCGAARQVNADVDTFKNFPSSQSGIIWKSQVMRADPLDVTLGICVRLLYPVRVPPPRLGGVCAFVAFCSLCSASCLCSVSAAAGLILYVCLHTCPADHATACLCADMSLNFY